MKRGGTSQDRMGAKFLSSFKCRKPWVQLQIIKLKLMCMKEVFKTLVRNEGFWLKMKSSIAVRNPHVIMPEINIAIILKFGMKFS